MIYNYEECLAMYKSFYQIKKAIREGSLYKIEKGIYADCEQPKELEIIIKRYPRAIFTLRSAFYFYGISDNIPDEYYLATDRDDTKIKDEKVVQLFYSKDILSVGVCQLLYNGVYINIYDKERMLIEAARYKNKMPFDYYKDIIEYYRNHKTELDIEQLQEYVDVFPKANVIDQIIQTEVF